MNTLIVIGNVGREPEMAYSPNGTAIAKFTVADSVPTKKDQPAETQWFNCVAFGKTAETLNQYVKKGMKVYLQGTLHARLYTTKEGAKGTSLDFTIDKFQFLEPRKTGDAAPASDDLPADFPF